MKPFSIYHHIEGQEDKLVKLILEVVSADAIFLLGASLFRRRSESIFCPLSPNSQYCGNYYFLILLGDTEGKPLSFWQERIEQSCACLMPVTVIVLTTTEFTTWLSSTHRFARMVVNNAKLVHQTDTFCLPEAAYSDPLTELASVTKHFKAGMQMSNEFFAGSELFTIRKHYILAIFMLHQSVEQALQALLITVTGYYCSTHNIDRLLRYAAMASYQLPDLFPKNNDKEKRLFSLLQKAYIEARYTNSFNVQEREVKELQERVRHLHEIVNNTIQSYFSTIEFQKSTAKVTAAMGPNPVQA